MALLALGVSRCSICREVLHPGQAIVATTHFIADEADPLSRYSDTGMHAACFAGWEHRAEFAARYEARLGIKLAAGVPAVPASVPAVPASPGAPLLPRSRMMVLGTPEERAGYFTALQNRMAPDAEPLYGPSDLNKNDESSHLA